MVCSQHVLSKIGAVGVRTDVQLLGAETARSLKRRPDSTYNDPAFSANRRRAPPPPFKAVVAFLAQTKGLGAYAILCVSIPSLGT